MRDLALSVRFFHVVSPIPPLMTGSFVILTVTGAAAILADMDRATGALAPVLLLQLLAASSGFAVPARRGHYDLLLTRERSRTRIAVAHWAASVAPGLASWFALALFEAIVSAGSHASLFATGTCAAVFLVSTLPWATTVALPRFSGGIGWILVAVTTVTTFSTDVMGHWSVPSTRIEELAWPAWSFLVYPIGPVGQHLGRPQIMAVVPALLLAVGAMAAACRWVTRRDIPLEAAQ
jgi:hypothetical protein